MENENVSSSVASSAVGSVASSSTSEETMETVVQPDPVDRPLLTTNFSDYTVSEGLLLLILLTLLVGGFIRFFKG